MRSYQVIIVFVVAVLGAFVYAGKESGGGDAVSAEFVSIGRVISGALQSKKLILPNLDVGAFNSIVETAEVVTKDRLFLNAAEKDAINYPLKKLIELSRFRWREYSGHLEKKISLVLHEYVSLLGVSDEKYALSNRVLADLSVLSSSTLEKIIVERIAAVCSDTWCEGDYSFVFEKFSCAEDAGCTLGFQMRLDEPNKSGASTANISTNRGTAKVLTHESGSYRLFNVSCTLDKYVSLESVVDIEAEDGRWNISLKKKFYLGLTDCIDVLETRLSK